jgi:chaperonin GroEL
MLKDTSGNQGLNVKTNEIGDMFDMGIVDPLKVTKTALKNAISVATTILTTNAIIANETNR